jgi:hypothetical protein
MPPLTPPSLDGLVQLSRKEGVDIRPSLLRVLTDLYVHEKSHTREEEQQYVELALRLLPAVDAATRAAVAGKLAAYPAAPAPVLARLAVDVAQVAAIVAARSATALAADSAPVLGRSLRVPSPPAGEGQGEGPLSSAPSAATPTPDPSPQGGGEREAVPASPPMTASYPPRPTHRVTPAAVHAALRGEPLAAGTRELPLGERFLQGDAAERRRLLDTLDEAAPNDAATLPPPESRAVVARLEAAALSRNQREFARELQYALRVSRQTAIRIVRDPSGEPTLVVARALDMAAEVLLRVLLFLNPTVGESVERVFALSRFYDRVSPAAATHIIAGWRDEAARRAAARYAGVHAEEAQDAGEATEGARRAVVGRTAEAPRQGEIPRSGAWRQRTS